MGLFDKLASAVAGDGVPDTIREELGLVDALADRGELGEAERRLETLVAEHPRVAAVQTALGDLRILRGDDEAAVTAYGRAVDLDTGATDAWLALGEALVRLRRPDPALDAFRRVLSQTD